MTHKEQPETALILERPAETERKKKTDKQINTLKKASKISSFKGEKKAPKITIGKMFLGLLKPIKIRYEKKSHIEKNNVSKKSLLSVLVTQFCRTTKDA